MGKQNGCLDVDRMREVKFSWRHQLSTNEDVTGKKCGGGDLREAVRQGMLLDGSDMSDGPDP